MRTEAAYDACVDITRARARNFYYGIRLLPADKRRAMSAVYAFARRVDDIGDGSLDRADKQRGLDDARQVLSALALQTRDPVLRALADAHDRFDLPLDALADLIAGVEMDVNGATYERFDDLVIYCRRVAGSIGRLCVAVFGTKDRAAAASAGDDLGVALQLTNILRDIREDGETGRTYLPAEELRAFGCPDLATATPAAVGELVRFQAARNREWFQRGLRVLELLDRRSAACAAAMSGIYQELLGNIEREPTRVLHERMSLSAREKAWVAGRSLVLARRCGRIEAPTAESKAW